MPKKKVNLEKVLDIIPSSFKSKGSQGKDQEVFAFTLVGDNEEDNITIICPSEDEFDIWYSAMRFLTPRRPRDSQSFASEYSLRQFLVEEDIIRI